MAEFIDPIYVCLYCGSTMGKPNEKMLAIFGEKALNCCEYPMAKVEKDKVFVVVKALDTVKANLEEEILKGLL